MRFLAACRTFKEHHAGATLSRSAPFLGAGQSWLGADVVQQRFERLLWGTDERTPIDLKLDRCGDHWRMLDHVRWTLDNAWIIALCAISALGWSSRFVRFVNVDGQINRSARPESR